MYFTDASMVWKPSIFHAIPVTCKDYKSEWMECNAEAKFSNKIKTEPMDLDNHLLASTMCGLISDFNGASNFINDKPDPNQITLACSWTRKLWVERHKDLQHLIDPNTASNIQATHVVVSVVYGAQMFCVFAQDVKGKEEDEQVRKVTQEKLAKILKRFQVAFDSQLNLEKFKQEFSKEEKHELADLKCRLYMDFKVEPVNECNLFDAYQYCVDFRRNISEEWPYRYGPIDVNKFKGVPIAIQLCPLQVLLPPFTTGGLVWFGKFRDVKVKLLNRCCRILVNLKRVVSRAEKMFAVVNTEETCPALRDFVYLVSKYQHFLQEDLKKAIVLARKGDHYLADDDVISIVNKARNHPLFKTSRLEQWIDTKEAEKNIMDLIFSKVGTTAVVLADASQLTEHVNNKCSLVLTVPPLDERTNETLNAMKKSFDENFPFWPSTNGGKPWHFVKSKIMLVLNYLKELVALVERNKEEPRQFIVTFGEIGKPFGCSYSVYENGNLLNRKFG